MFAMRENNVTGFVVTHNKDGQELAYEVVRRAWTTMIPRPGDAPTGIPLNHRRCFNGGATVGDVLSRAAAVRERAVK